MSNWLTFSELSGSGNTTLTVSASAVGDVSRSALYKCTTNTRSKNIMFLQYSNVDTYGILVFDFPAHLAYSAYTIRLTSTNDITEMRLDDGEWTTGRDCNWSKQGSEGRHTVDFKTSNLIVPSNLVSTSKYFIEANIPDGFISISNYAFYNCANLSAITLGNTIYYIGEYSFQYPDFQDYEPIKTGGLKFINIPDSVVSAGTEAFYGQGLTGATIGSGLTELNALFRYNYYLEKIHIPSTVKTINHLSFQEAYNLSSFTMDYGVEYLGAKDMYSGYTKEQLCNGQGYEGTVINHAIITELIIPDSVKQINGRLISNAPNLTGLTIPDSVTSPLIFTAKYNDSLTYVSIGSGVPYLAAEAFIWNSIETINFGNITDIGKKAFERGFSRNVNVGITLPSTLVKIYTQAFINNPNLTGITFQSNLQEIGDNAFSGCGLTLINSYATTAPTLGTDVFSNLSSNSGVLHYPAGSDYSTWLTALGNNWRGFADL